MKANHNNLITVMNIELAVINTSKIQNESKSQQLKGLVMLTICCYQYVKDTK